MRRTTEQKGSEKAPKLTKSQRKLLLRVIDYPSQYGRPYRPRGRFTTLSAARLVYKGVLEPVGDHYRALYDPREKRWL